MKKLLKEVVELWKSQDNLKCDPEQRFTILDEKYINRIPKQSIKKVTGYTLEQIQKIRTEFEKTGGVMFKEHKRYKPTSKKIK